MQSTDQRHAHRPRRPALARFTLKALPLAAALCCGVPVQAQGINPGVAGLPQGGTVAAGAVAGDLSGNRLTLTQSTARAVLDWRTFSIDAGKEVRFVQPDAGSAVLNRVSASAGMSEIYGVLNANGAVLLMNPNGVLFGRGASINVGSLVATTGTVNDSRFMQEGVVAITGSSAGSVRNQGNITAAHAGLVALVAPSVSNAGTIVANAGTIVLAGASTATVSLNGGLFEFATGGPGASVGNSGMLQADGGAVLLTAAGASGVVDSVINMDGVIQARTAEQRGGVIVLDGGDAGRVQVSGQLDARGPLAQGGRITVTGRAVELAAVARVDASGEGGGTVLVGGNWQGQGPERTAMTTTVAQGTTLAADGGARGNGGTVVVWADGDTRFQGVISARGGTQAGDGGRVEVSGKRTLGYDGTVDASATAGQAGRLLLDPLYAIISSNAAGTAGDTQTINATALAGSLSGTDVTVQADNRITVDAVVDASRNANKHNLALNAPAIDLNAKILLKDNAALTGTASVVNVNGSNASIQNGVDVAANGATVNVTAGTYAEQVSIGKSGLTLAGAAGAKVLVPDGPTTLNGPGASYDGITIKTNTPNVTVSGFDVAGPLTSAYYLYYAGDKDQYPWTNISRGIVVQQGAAGFALTGNTLHDLRTGILVNGLDAAGTGAISGRITGNRIENTKSGVSVQYTDGAGITLSGNSQGPIGNEWGINLHLNGFLGGGVLRSNPYPAAPTLGWQQALLNLSAANGSSGNPLSVQDQGYTSSNRTQAMVATSTHLDAATQGSPLTPFTSVQAGVDAVVTGGQVAVGAGTYAQNVSIGKAVTLKGAGAGQTLIEPTGGTAVTISGDIGATASVTLDGLTFRNAPAYGVRVDGGTTLGQLTISNSAFTGMGRNGFLIDGNATSGAPGLASVTFTNATFTANGLRYDDPAISSLGYGDLSFNYYNGNVRLDHVRITGNGEFMGIQMRGVSPTANVPISAGTVVFNDVTIDGSFRRPANARGTWNPGGPGDAIHILEYASVAGMSFNNVVITPTVGHGMFLEGLGSTLNIGDTRFGAPDTTITGSGAFPTISRNIYVGTNNNNAPTNVDAGLAAFTGAADGFAIEDRVLHALDFSGLGLVTWNPGNVYVTQASGSVQRGLDAAGGGNTVNVAAGSFAENLALNARYNLRFNDTLLQGLTLSAAAANSGLGGKVTATTATGIAIHAPIRLLANTTLATQGADVVLGGDVQNAGSVPYTLALTAGVGSNRGNAYMTTGGTSANPLGLLDVDANNFTLADTLWVTAYQIDARGNVALSNHTLNATAPGVTNTLAATGNVTGSTTSQGSIEVVSSAQSDVNIAAQGRASVAAETVRGTLSGSEVVATAQESMQVTVTASSTATLVADMLTATVVAPTVAVEAGGGAQLNLQSTTATVRAEGPVVVQGSASSVVVDAPSGSLQGSFGDVNNAGTGLFSVNGRPELNQTLSANAENNRVIPGSSALAGSQGTEPVSALRPGQVVATLAGRSDGGVLVRGSSQAAGTAILEQGQSVELDLTPGREREPAAAAQ